MQVSLDSIKEKIECLLESVSGHPLGTTTAYLDGYLSGLRDGNTITHEHDASARNRMIEILRECAADLRKSRSH